MTPSLKTYTCPKKQNSFFSLSNSHWHLANADLIANVKSKIIQCFFASKIFYATSKVQNY